MLPLRSTCTLMTSPQRPPFMLLGSVGQPSTSRYGLGSSPGLGYWICRARADTPNVAMTTTMASVANPARPGSSRRHEEQEEHRGHGGHEELSVTREITPGRHPGRDA